MLQSFVSLTGTLHSSRIWFVLTSFHILSCHCLRLIKQFINFGRIFCRAEHFLRKIKASPCLSALLTKSCPPKYDFLRLLNLCFEPFINYFGPEYFPSIFMYLLLFFFFFFFPHLIYRHLFAVTHHSVWCFFSILFLSAKILFSFDIDLSSS